MKALDTLLLVFLLLCIGLLMLGGWGVSQAGVGATVEVSPAGVRAIPPTVAEEPAQPKRNVNAKYCVYPDGFLGEKAIIGDVARVCTANGWEMAK